MFPVLASQCTGRRADDDENEDNDEDAIATGKDEKAAAVQAGRHRGATLLA